MQILDIVAITQVRNLRAEVEKGFAVTVLEGELVDPKAHPNRAERRTGRVSFTGSSSARFFCRKGSGLIFSHQDIDILTAT